MAAVYIATRGLVPSGLPALWPVKFLDTVVLF